MLILWVTFLSFISIEVWLCIMSSYVLFAVALAAVPATRMCCLARAILPQMMASGCNRFGAPNFFYFPDEHSSGLAENNGIVGGGGGAKKVASRRAKD